MKSGNLNFLEPSGPLQACDGTALPILFLCLYYACYICNVTYFDLFRIQLSADRYWIFETYIFVCVYVHYSVQNLLSSRLLSKNLKIKIYRTIIFPVVLYGCEADIGGGT
jgi:hypothetical protein